MNLNENNDEFGGILWGLVLEWTFTNSTNIENWC
jgi:hypothetical protein